MIMASLKIHIDVVDQAATTILSEAAAREGFEVTLGRHILLLCIPHEVLKVERGFRLDHHQIDEYAFIR